MLVIEAQTDLLLMSVISEIENILGCYISKEVIVGLIDVISALYLKKSNFSGQRVHRIGAGEEIATPVLFQVNSMEVERSQTTNKRRVKLIL